MADTSGDQNNNNLNKTDEEGVDPPDRDLRTLYPYPGKTKSKVWDYFGFYKVKDGPPTKNNLDMTLAICKLCKKRYTNKGNTTNFLNHIEHEHDGMKQSSSSGSKPKQQQSMDSFVNVNTAGKINPERQDKIDDALCKFIAGKAVPLSIVDNILFRTFIGLLDPRYKVPSRATVTRKLDKKKNEMEEKLKKEIAGTKNVAVTHDSWTSLNTESFFSTTVHFIDNSWVLKSAVLGTIKVTGSHTSEKISEELKVTQQRWALPEPIATTDNAANEQKAFQLLGWERYGCYGHRINLIVKNAINIPEVVRLLGKARKLVTFFHQSTSINDLLVEKQRIMFDGKENLIGHKLVIDVVTRWNSTLYMLQRLTEQFPALMSLANDPSLSKHASTTLKNCLFSFEEQSLIENIVQILQPFEQATNIVCADKTPTIQKIVPIVIKLLRITQVCEDDPPIIKKIKERMSVEINNRSVGGDRISLLGCILNPFTKDMSFATQQKEEALKILREEIHGTQVVIKKEKETEDAPMSDEVPTLPQMTDISMERQESDDAEPEVKKMKIKSIDTDTFLEDVVCVGETKRDDEDVAAIEIQRYMGSKILEKDHSLTVLQWWKEHEPFYPRISQIAKKILSVPASSVSSERVFSLCGQIVNKKRCRLSSKNVDLLVFLNKNIQYW